MKLMALLYPRPGELRQAEWTEFDLDKATWTIPEERAKMRRVHRKPLPPLAIDILREQQRHTGNLRLVFPSSTSLERPISENTLNQSLRRMGFEKHEATSHGFRATASTLLGYGTPMQSRPNLHMSAATGSAAPITVGPIGGNASEWPSGGPRGSGRFWETTPFRDIGADTYPHRHGSPPLS